MIIGIIGLGLIGGSMAKAISEKTGHTVYGADLDDGVCATALRDGAISRRIGPGDYKQCDILIVALYPGAVVSEIKGNAENIKPETLVIDCCGTKQTVCRALFPIARKYGFTFIGGHPMAGVERFGYEASDAKLFSGAFMILTPPSDECGAELKIAENLFHDIGFGGIRYCTPEEHDKMIAYTSQLAHVVSSSYVQSPSAFSHLGFSAGSFLDMTRVARLNEAMWTELFIDNKESLVPEIDGIIERLEGFRDAISSEDRGRLFDMLKTGREIKEAVDGKGSVEKRS